MLEIFQYDFMIRAFVIGLTLAVIAPMIGLFLVVRRYSYLADTLSHVSLAGIAAASFFQFNPIFFTLGATIIAGLGIERVRETRKIPGEAVLTLFLSASLATATIFFSITKNASTNFTALLFGSIATTTISDVWVTLGIAGVVIFLVTFLYKELFLVASDEEFATASGMHTKLLNTILMITASVVVALSIRIVGILLIGSLMTIPVLAAMQLRKGFFVTICSAIGYSFVAVVSGLVISYYANVASGGAIVGVSVILFLITLVITRKN